MCSMCALYILRMYLANGFSLCPVSCPALPAPVHGSLSTSDTSPGITVSVVCDDDYTFNPTTGNPSVVCGADGVWNSTLAGCKQGL